MLLKPDLSPVHPQSPGESPNPSALSFVQRKLGSTKENIVDRRVIAIGCGNLRWDYTQASETEMPQGFIYKTEDRKDVRRILLQDLNDMISAFARVTGCPTMLVTTAPEMPPEYPDPDVTDYLLENNTTIIASENINRKDADKINDFARTFVEKFGKPWASEWPERAFSAAYLQGRSPRTPARFTTSQQYSPSPIWGGRPLAMTPAPSASTSDPFTATLSETRDRGERILERAEDLARILQIETARISELGSLFSKVLAKEAMGETMEKK